MKMNEPPLGAVIVALYWIPAFVVIYSGHIQKMDCTELCLYCSRGAQPTAASGLMTVVLNLILSQLQSFMFPTFQNQHFTNLKRGPGPWCSVDLGPMFSYFVVDVTQLNFQRFWNWSTGHMYSAATMAAV